MSIAAPEPLLRPGWRALDAALCAVALAVMALAVLALLSIGQALGADYPALTGRVTDAAAIIDPATKAQIEGKLAALEEKSGIQLVVATVKSLGGQAIDPYANELFRAWKLGEAKNNNGVLLLVAPNERRVRIEVGYGLEGTLTDAVSSLIVANAMAPRFKAKDYPGGIARGVDDIITTLTTDAGEWQKRPRIRPEDQTSMFETLLPLLVMLIFAFVILSMARNAASGTGGAARLGRRGCNVIFIPSGGFGGGGGGGFSGGGGSSGGGGASGGW